VSIITTTRKSKLEHIHYYEISRTLLRLVIAHTRNAADLEYIICIHCLVWPQGV